MLNIDRGCSLLNVTWTNFWLKDQIKVLNIMFSYMGYWYLGQIFEKIQFMLSYETKSYDAADDLRGPGHPLKKLFLNSALPKHS